MTRLGVVPGHWAVWCFSLCVAAGLWKWTLEWTVWCGHGHLGSDMHHGSLLLPRDSLDPLHLSSSQRWLHWGCAGSLCCSVYLVGENGLPVCWILYLVENCIKTKLCQNKSDLWFSLILSELLSSKSNLTTLCRWRLHWVKTYCKLSKITYVL